jgi:hypothetical protein
LRANNHAVSLRGRNHVIWCRNAGNKLARSPEMKHLSNATMIFAFGL